MTAQKATTQPRNIIKFIHSIVFRYSQGHHQMTLRVNSQYVSVWCVHVNNKKRKKRSKVKQKKILKFVYAF